MASLLRLAEAAGGHGAVLGKGDPDRGVLLLIVASRGVHVACLERRLDLAGNYAWAAVGPARDAQAAELRDFLQKRRRFDPDSWLIELDVADAERFIAEIVAIG